MVLDQLLLTGCAKQLGVGDNLGQVCWWITLHLDRLLGKVKVYTFDDRRFAWDGNKHVILFEPN